MTHPLDQAVASGNNGQQLVMICYQSNGIPEDMLGNEVSTTHLPLKYKVNKQSIRYSWKGSCFLIREEEYTASLVPVAEITLHEFLYLLLTCLVDCSAAYLAVF